MSIFNEKICMRAFGYLKSLDIEGSGEQDSLLFRKTDLGPFNQERGEFYKRKLLHVIIAAQ